MEIYSKANYGENNKSCAPLTVLRFTKGALKKNSGKTYVNQKYLNENYTKIPKVWLCFMLIPMLIFLHEL